MEEGLPFGSTLGGRNSIKRSFSLLLRKSTVLNGAVSEYWDTSLKSWSINFRRCLKEEEIADFQSLLGVARKLVSEFPERRR